MTNPLLTPFLIASVFRKTLPEHAVVQLVTKALYSLPRKCGARSSARSTVHLGKSLPAVGGSGRCAGAILLPGQPPELGEK
ncbi:hypothetical protein ACLB1T_09840 [Escherichia coli]